MIRIAGGIFAVNKQIPGYPAENENHKNRWSISDFWPMINPKKMEILATFSYGPDMSGPIVNYVQSSEDSSSDS